MYEDIDICTAKAQNLDKRGVFIKKKNGKKKEKRK